MLYVRRKHRGPKVVMVQILVNRHTPSVALEVDGIFGKNTDAGVQEFQRFAKINDDGIVGKDTWRKLKLASGMQIVDVVDNTANDSAGEISTIRAAGGEPIVMFGMCNGVGQAMSFVVQRANGPGSIVLLRMHAHGASGSHNVSGGVDDFDAHLAGIALSNFSQIQGSLASVKPYLAPFASAELHGCNVGRGTAGRKLINKLRDVWEVPVSAGMRSQYAGTKGSQFVFEGPVYTAYPGGSLSKWAGSVAHHGHMKMPTTF